MPLHQRLTVEALPSGGFLVTENNIAKNLRDAPIYASAEIDHVLEFLRLMLTATGSERARLPKCNRVLAGEGLAYPRTCAECGLGACKLSGDVSA